MKTAFFIIAMALSTFAHATETTGHSEQFYQCVASRLQAVNSDIYYDITPTDIENTLKDPSAIGYYLVVEMAQSCEDQGY